LRTVRYSTLDSPLQFPGQPATLPGQSAVQELETKLRGNSSILDLKNHCYSPPDSPGLGAGQSASTDTEQQRTHRKEPDSRTVHYSTPDCPRIVQTEEQERPQNRLLTSIFRFVAKPSPTATKLGEHNHKIVGELFLRGHCPI
jgi:hypothetical protein